MRHGYRSNGGVATRPSGRRRLRRRIRNRRRLLFWTGVAVLSIAVSAILWRTTLPDPGLSARAGEPSQAPTLGSSPAGLASPSLESVPPTTTSPAPTWTSGTGAPATAHAVPGRGSGPDPGPDPGPAQAVGPAPNEPAATLAPVVAPAAAPGPSTPTATVPTTQAAVPAPTPTPTPSKCSPLSGLGGLLGGKPCR